MLHFILYTSLSFFLFSFDCNFRPKKLFSSSSSASFPPGRFLRNGLSRAHDNWNIFNRLTKRAGIYHGALVLWRFLGLNRGEKRSLALCSLRDDFPSRPSIRMLQDARTRDLTAKQILLNLNPHSAHISRCISAYLHFLCWV